MEPIITVNEYPLGWEWLDKVPLEEIISNTTYFNFNVDDAIYEVLTMPREEITL